MLMSTLLSHKFTSVDIFQCLRHGIRNHDSVPKWELYVLNLKEKKMPSFFFWTPNAEPLSEPCSSLRGAPICKLRSLRLSCKTVVKPDVAASLTLIFKGNVSKRVCEEVCILSLVCGYHRTLPHIFLCNRNYSDYFKESKYKTWLKALGLFWVSTNHSC